MTDASPRDLFWRRKLLAFLHDPPDKPYDYSPEHEKTARVYMTRLVGGFEEWRTLKAADHEAAAADRFIFPDGTKLHSSLGGGLAFHHPLAGSDLAEGLVFPDQVDVIEALSDCCPEFENTSAQQRFFFVWRLWMAYAATHPNTQNRHIEMLPYLPADTRIPDSSIWHHVSVTSALEGTRNNEGSIDPAFLIIQIGPVQEFIQQARSTRDLWSGSYLLSWMMAKLLHRFSEELGPDSVIFPCLRGQPLMDHCSRELLKAAAFGQSDKTSVSYWESSKLDKLGQQLIFIPNLPNRCLLVVPRDFDPKPFIDSIFGFETEDSEWGKIAQSCERLLAGYVDRSRFTAQVKAFWQVTWQMWPWHDAEKALEELAKLSQTETSLHCVRKAINAIPSDVADDRHYEDKRLKLLPGWAWGAHYQLASHAADARRKTRDFAPWIGCDGVRKDDLSGREEAVIDLASEESRAGLPGNVKHLFRKGERLGAPNFIKRVWHQAYLQKEQGLGARRQFDSVPSIAAAAWIDSLERAISKNEEAWAALLDASVQLDQERNSFEDSVIPDPIPLSNKLNEGDWLRKVDPQVFHKATYSDGTAPKSAKAIQTLITAAKMGRPPTYFAVLCMDGDDMGKWVSGEKTPKIGQLLAPKAAKYFETLGVSGEGMLDAPRPVSPSYHLQLSEALSNFALFAVRRIVEVAHHGQLIYAGGDDVVAMVPVSEAYACAKALTWAFSGAPELWRSSRYQALFDKAPTGFIKLKAGDPRQGGRLAYEPVWPLLVPGPRATLSAGIAIAHMQAPLQNIVRASHETLERAKKIDSKREDKLATPKAACATALFKRSGETLHWQAKWKSNSIDLVDRIAEHLKDGKLSGRFPYAVASQLRRYSPCDSIETLVTIFEAEVEYILNRQSADSFVKSPERVTLQQLIMGHIQGCTDKGFDDFLGPFLTAAFLNRTEDSN